MSRPEIGLGIQGDKQPGDYALLAAMAEGWGIDVLSVYGDLRFQPPLGPLVEMARATDHVRLGPAALNPYTMHPYEIAGNIAWLDLVSHGRAYLGLVRGTWLGDIGLEQPQPLVHLEEAASIVRALLAGDTAGFAGQVFSLEPGMALRYVPCRTSVPLLVGAWGPRTLALAGRIADEVKVGGSANPDVVPVVQHRVAAGGATSSTEDRTRIVMGAVSVVDDDGGAARARARHEVAMYLAVVAELDPTFEVDPELLARMRELISAGESVAAGAIIPDTVLDRFAFSGTPEQVAGQVQALLEAGADRVELGTPHGLTWQRGVELIGSAVLPALER